MAIATTIAVSAQPSPLSGGLMPSAGANAPPAMDGFDAVFSAILAQIADGAVGNNQPQAAIPAVANDAGVPAIQPSATCGDVASAAGDVDPFGAAPAVADPNAALPATPVAPPANDTKQGAAPLPANINAAAAVSLLEAQIAAAPVPKAATGNVAAESKGPSPKQTVKTAAPAPTADPSLLAAATAVPVPPPVSPVAPASPEDATALAANAPSAAPPALPPIGDADADDSDGALSSSQATPAGAGATSQDQAIAASSAGDFLADLKSSMSEAQTAPAATPAANAPQFATATQPAPATRKAAAAPSSDASNAKPAASTQKSDANTTALTRLAANDPGTPTGEQKSDAASSSAQAPLPTTQETAPAPAAAAPLSNPANDASSALAAQQPLQTNAATSAVALHVAPQTQGPHAATTSDLDSLAINIAAKSLDGIKHFDIRLDPPELGRVEVRLSVGDDGKAQASLSVDRPQTLQLLQNDASNLNRALKDAGLNLSDSGLSFSLRGQDRQASDGGGSQHKGRSLSVRALASIDAASSISSNAYSSLSPDTAGVDIRV